MRLTALCICGTLLALLSFCWTTVDSDEGDLLGDNGFGPCAVTLRPEGPCRHEQYESTCPYLLSLPPLTVHLPKQLRELDTIVEDLQKLKDNVDQLRKMCADCTVSQPARECGRQRESEHEKLNEGSNGHKNERNWLSETNPERLKDFNHACMTDRVKTGKTMRGNSDTDSEKRTILEEKGGKKWEAERDSDEVVVKENENEKNPEQVTEKDGKTQAEGAKGKDKLEQAAVPAASGNDRKVDVVIKKVAEQSNRGRETGRNKEKHRKGNSKGDREDTENEKDRKITSIIKNKEKTEQNDHNIWRHETKEREKKTQTAEDRGSDGIKMSEEHDEHTNKEREHHSEERKMELEKRIKVEQNNEKPKQTESIECAEKEKTIKKGKVGEDKDSETGNEIKTEGEQMVQSVQRDSDGDLASSKAIERTDIVSVSPTPHATTSLYPTHSMDSKEATSFASSLPSPHLTSSTAIPITSVNKGMTITADTLPTTSTDIEADGIFEHSSIDAEAGFWTTSRPATTATISTMGDQGQQITSATIKFASATSARSGAGPQGQVSSTMATATTTAHQNLHTTTFTGVADHSPWTAKKNISLNITTGMKPPPGPGPMPGEKQKPVIKLEEDLKLKNPKNDRKRGEAPLSDKKANYNQKQKLSHQKPIINQKSEPDRDSERVQIPEPDQRPLPDNLATDRHPESIQKHKHGREHTTAQKQLPVQKPKPHQKSVPPVQRPTTLNTTGSDKDPLTHQEPKPVVIPSINQNLKPQKNPVHPLKTDKPDQKQKPHEDPKGEEKTKPDQSSTLNHYFTPVQVPEPENSETVSFTSKPKQKPVTELVENSGDNPLTEPKSVQDSSRRQKLIPDHGLIKLPDQEVKPSNTTLKIEEKSQPVQTPKHNQKHPEIQTKPNVKPKPGQTSQPNQELKTPQRDQTPNNRSVDDEISDIEPNKAAHPRSLPRYGTPTEPTVEPGATSAHRPKSSIHLKPRPKTKTDLDPPQTTRTTSDGIQNAQTDMPPASGPVKQTADTTHSPGEREVSPKEVKTITLGSKTSNSLEIGPSPRLHTLNEDFTISPNSRIMSDLRPQTDGQPPSIPMTTRPNKIMHGILSSVIPSISPGSTKPKQVSNTDSRLPAKILHSMEETVPRPTPNPGKMMNPVLSPRAQTFSTASPDLRLTNPATSGPDPRTPEASTASARELRVKINQVAAFFNNSLQRPIEKPKDNQGDSKHDSMDSKPPMLVPSKVNTMMRDCSDYLLSGDTNSGVYLVTPDLRSRSFPVFCDMELGGGGWTLLQRRQDGSVSFNRTWAEYRSGFGELDGEFWLGNNLIHLLTRDRDMVLRVELEDFDGATEYAVYEQFRVASERMRYRLTVGGYSGTAGDALRFSKSYDHNNRQFTTPDRDHDRYPSGNCGAYYSSGWWFDACMAANLNGRYYVGKYKGVRDGIFWGTWHNISTEYYPTNDRQSFKSVRMMIRPKGFAP